jgi:AGCS family alanine or glycine:cation symporter
VFSTLTALALESSGFSDVGIMYFRVFGSFGRVVLPSLLAIFGFASIISWCFYAESSIKFLFSDRSKVVSLIYRIAVSLLSFAGAVAAATVVWDLADIFNALMMFPNLYLLFNKRKEICLCFGTKKR